MEAGLVGPQEGLQEGSHEVEEGFRSDDGDSAVSNPDSHGGRLM